MSKEDQTFSWNPKRRKVAELLATGMFTQKAAAEVVGVRGDTVSKWKQHPEFWEEVDRLTNKQEMATRAGLLRKAYYALNVKLKSLEEDRSTMLDYLKFIASIAPLDQNEEDDRLMAFTEAIRNAWKPE